MLRNIVNRGDSVLMGMHGYGHNVAYAFWMIHFQLLSTYQLLYNSTQCQLLAYQLNVVCARLSQSLCLVSIHH